MILTEFLQREASVKINFRNTNEYAPKILQAAEGRAIMPERIHLCPCPGKILSHINSSAFPLPANFGAYPQGLRVKNLFS